MTVEDDRYAFDFMNEIIGGQRVKIVGDQQVALSDKEQQEEADIELGVKQRPFTEQQMHAMACICPAPQRNPVSQIPADKHNMESKLDEGLTGPVHALVGDQVIGN